MTPAQVLSLLLALSGALNIAFAAGIIACWNGATFPKTIMVGGSAASVAIGLFLTGVGVYH
ncbi:hypothetical protein GCM10010411_75170 [Actinomadura fulvescens]|uniref:Uncharacterized protein n=1 Tax=Actinomadura fulvescens TaxID=46160 RepID=A0ABN3QI15_9ACTN